MPVGPPREVIRAVSEKKEVIELLDDGIDDRRDLVELLPHSRSTVDRALRRFEELGIVESLGSDYRLTNYGRHVNMVESEMTETVDAFERIADLLSLLPLDATISHPALDEATVVRSKPSAPHAPEREINKVLSEGETIRWLTPALSETLIGTLDDRVCRGWETELILPESLTEYLWVDQDGSWRSFVESSSSTIIQLSDRPGFGIMVGADCRVVLMFHDEYGAIKGCAVSKSTQVESWATSQIEQGVRTGRKLLTRSSEATADVSSR